MSAKPPPILTITLHRLNPGEWDWTCEKTGQDGHIRWEDQQWLMDVWRGEDHLFNIDCGRNPVSPDWNLVMEEITPMMP